MGRRSRKHSSLVCPLRQTDATSFRGPGPEHVAGSSVVSTLRLEPVPPREQAVPIHHTDYRWEVSAVLLSMSSPLDVLSSGTVLTALC